MALLPCRECGQSVSTEAPFCPRCGVPEPARRPPAPQRAAAPHPPPREDAWGGYGGVAVIGGLALLIVIAVFTAVAGGEADAPNASAYTSARPPTSPRASDSAAAAATLARSSRATTADLFRAESAIHTHGLPLPHDSIHTRYISAALDSIATLLNPGSGGAGDYIGAMAMNGPHVLFPPLTAQQERRAAEVAARARAAYDKGAARTASEAAGGRANRVRDQSDCKPPLAKVRRLVERHADWSDDILSTVACGKIHLGMTKEQVIAGWGRPRDINRTTYSFGVHEQWVYGEYGGGYVYFEDGVVTTIQN